MPSGKPVSTCPGHALTRPSRAERTLHIWSMTAVDCAKRPGTDVRETIMAQQQARAGALDKVDPVWARIRREAEEIARREPELATFIYSTILHHDTLEAAVVHRVAERLDSPEVSAELIRQAYADALEERAGDRRGVPRRHRGDRRSRSRNQPLARAGALLQGLPRHPDPSPGPLAVGQGPQGFRLLSAEPVVGGVPDRHQSGGARSGAESSSTMPPAWWSARPQ